MAGRSVAHKNKQPQSDLQTDVGAVCACAGSSVAIDIRVVSLADEARQMRERVSARLRELEPLVREYEELMRVAAEMGIEPRADGRGRRSGSPTRRPRKPAKPQSEAPRGASPGELSDRVLAAVRSEPGMTLGEYAEVLGVSQSALYRPVRELTNDGAIVKRARQLFPE
jgi:DNA-binding transcriptional ArsR family regulator